MHAKGVKRARQARARHRISVCRERPRRCGRARADHPVERAGIEPALPEELLEGNRRFAVPAALREAGYALGYSRFRVAMRVVVPAAFSGITAAFILGMSRAVGETMVVAIAAGQNPNFSFNPTEGAATITAYIVQMAMGDLPHGSIAYQSVFAAGIVLFVITLIFNLIGFFLRRRYKEVY